MDVVTSSHNHTDHLDGETLIPLWKANPKLKILVSGANVRFRSRTIAGFAGTINTYSCRWRSSVTIDPFVFHAIPSAHEALEQDENGDHRFIGLIIQIGKWTIYHSGDCIPYDGLAERLTTWKIDLALLPINGRDPACGVPGNFRAEEAVQLGKDIGAGAGHPLSL